MKEHSLKSAPTCRKQATHHMHPRTQRSCLKKCLIKACALGQSFAGGPSHPKRPAPLQALPLTCKPLAACSASLASCLLSKKESRSAGEAAPRSGRPSSPASKPFRVPWMAERGRPHSSELFPAILRERGGQRSSVWVAPWRGWSSHRGAMDRARQLPAAPQIPGVILPSCSHSPRGVVWADRHNSQPILAQTEVLQQRSDQAELAGCAQ